jgi:hypothetical protein
LGGSEHLHQYLMNCLQYRLCLAIAKIGLEALCSPKMSHNFLINEFLAMVPYSNQSAVQFCIGICLESLFIGISIDFINEFVQPLQ